MSKAVTDKPAEGNGVKCENCHSPYAIDPAKRKTSGASSQKARFRRRVDVATNRIVILCNKCGIQMSRGKKRPPKKVLPTDEEKYLYLEEAKMFATALAERLEEPDAKNLYCPNIQSNPCGCIQKYIKQGEMESPETDERVYYLLNMLKNAKELSTEKMHTASSSGVKGNTSEKKAIIISRGNGNRHSQTFEDFVLSNRKHLKDQLKFCERANQKILMYSNNFLHKELKSIKNQRVERKRSRHTKLKPITELASINCCKDQCVQQAVTQPDTLESWRQYAQEGQREARRVIAEMLTPSVGSKANCYRFISHVTGCSFTTISSVKNHLKNTNGSWDPPEHGLRKWWRENPKKSKEKEESAASEAIAKILNEDDFKLNEAVDGSALLTPANSQPPPSYETVVCSQNRDLQRDSPNEEELFVLEENVDLEVKIAEQCEKVNEATELEDANNVMDATTTSVLQSTVEQLLMSPDIVSVTVVAAPKIPGRQIQIMKVDSREELLLTQTTEAGPGMNSANYCKVIQFCHQAPLENSDTMENPVEDNFGLNTEGNCDIQQPVGHSTPSFTSIITNPAPESLQKRQLLHVFEIPQHQTLSQISDTSYLAEKTQPQMLSIIAPSELESLTGTTACEEGGMRNIIILPEIIDFDLDQPFTE